MSIRMQHNVLQLLLYCAFIKQILITEAIVLSSLNNGGQWTFQEGENVTLVCTIDPYTTIQVWKFNNIKVAECVLTACITHNTESGVFTFTQFINTTYGVFYWTINPMKIEFKNNLITCNDGSSTEVTRTITVQGRDSNGDNGESQSNKKLFGLFSLAALGLFGLIALRERVPGIHLQGESISDTEIVIWWEHKPNPKFTKLYWVVKNNYRHTNNKVEERWTSTFRENTKDTDEFLADGERRELTKHEIRVQKCIVNNLKPGTRYVFLIEGKNDIRTTIAQSNAIEIKTLELKVGAIESGTASFKITRFCGQSISKFGVIVMDKTIRKINLEDREGKFDLTNYNYNPLSTSIWILDSSSTPRCSNIVYKGVEGVCDIDLRLESREKTNARFKLKTNDFGYLPSKLALVYISLEDLKVGATPITHNTMECVVVKNLRPDITYWYFILAAGVPGKYVSNITGGVEAEVHGTCVSNIIRDDTVGTAFIYQRPPSPPLPPPPPSQQQLQNEEEQEQQDHRMTQ